MGTLNNGVFEFDSGQLLDLRDYLYQERGFYCPDNIIESKLVSLVNHIEMYGFDSIGKFIEYLKLSNQKEVINKILLILTDNGIHFFDNIKIFEFLKEIIIPEIIKSNGKTEKRINIWDVSCSTGEFAYSLAMFINEKLIPDNPGISFKINATDVNVNSLGVAREGSYPLDSVKYLPDELIEKYFETRENSIKIKKEIRELVNFRNKGTEKNIYWKDGTYDLIFCRNFLIYFNKVLKQNLFENMTNALNTGGFILPGQYESFADISHHMLPVTFNEITAYRRI